MEPPGEDVPDPRDDPPEAEPAAGDVAPRVDPLAVSAACAAGVLALVGSGHVLVLGALLLAVARTRVAAAALLLACTATLVRWGSASLADIAGAQAVLGPAVLVGSTAAALSALLAGAAVVLLARDRLTAPAFGLVGAALVAGPAFPHDLGVRVVGAVVAVLAALLATRLPRAAGAVAVAAGAAALLLAALA